MGYVWSTEEIVKVLHKIRWSDEMPERFEGLSFNLVMETAVDRLAQLEAENERLRAALRTLRQWDMLDSAGDGPWAKRLIDAALSTPEETEP